jgi:hypothetical protein
MTNLAALLVDNLNGATFISIDSTTVPVLSGGKANPFKEHTLKHNKGSSVMVFQNKNGTSGYQNMVVRRLTSEGKDADFSVGPRQWGERIPNTCFVRHTKDGVTKYYIEVIFLRNGTVTYTVDDVETPKEAIQGLTDKEEGYQNGLENKVIIRTYAVDSITAITINKNRYEDLTFDLSVVTI